MTGSSRHHLPPIERGVRPAAGTMARRTPPPAAGRPSRSRRPGRPTARCGSAPTIMPIAVTAIDLHRRRLRAPGASRSAAAARVAERPGAWRSGPPPGRRAASAGAARRTRSARRTRAPRARRLTSGRPPSARPTTISSMPANATEQRPGPESRAWRAGAPRGVVPVGRPSTSAGSRWSAQRSRSRPGARLPARVQPRPAPIAAMNGVDEAPGRTAGPTTCAARRSASGTGRAPR